MAMQNQLSDKPALLQHLQGSKAKCSASVDKKRSARFQLARSAMRNAGKNAMLRLAGNNACAAELAFAREHQRMLARHRVVLLSVTCISYVEAPPIPVRSASTTLCKAIFALCLLGLGL
jgi:hypothetical protein